MGLQKMGFEGLIYKGTAGSTAASLLENTKDISVTKEHTRGNTTVRGDSTEAPMQTEDVTVRVASIQWTMIHDTSDTLYEDLCEAADSGEAVAIRTKKHSSGKGFDGDCTITAQDGMPLEGEQTTQFTATPTRAAGRAPQSHV